MPPGATPASEVPIRDAAGRKGTRDAPPGTAHDAAAHDRPGATPHPSNAGAHGRHGQPPHRRRDDPNGRHGNRRGGRSGRRVRSAVEHAAPFSRICGSERHAPALRARRPRAAHGVPARLPGILVRVEEPARRIQPRSHGSRARSARLQPVVETRRKYRRTRCRIWSRTCAR